MSTTTDPTRVDHRAERRELRRSLGRFSQLKRLRACGRRVQSTDQGVAVKLTEAGAYFSGLQTCGSVWACPVCAPRVREARAGEIEQGLGAHFDRGGSAYFVTATLPHDFGDRLAPLMTAVGQAWRALLSGRRWVDDRDRFGIVGTIRATEVTHGRNGWHPHLHVLVLTVGHLEDHELAELTDRLAGRWATGIEDAGYRVPSAAHGLTCSEVRSRDQVAAYTAKIDGGWGVAREVTRHDLKAGRRHGQTPFALAADAVDGLAEAHRLWSEYETATRGRHAIQWSRGLKARLGVGERTDEDIAGEDQAGEVVALLDVVEWSYVVRWHLEGALLDAAARPSYIGPWLSMLRGAVSLT